MAAKSNGITLGESVELWLQNTKDFARFMGYEDLQEVADLRKATMYRVLEGIWDIDWDLLDAEGLAVVLEEIEPIWGRLMMWRWLYEVHATAVDEGWFINGEEIEHLPTHWVPEGVDWKEPDDIPSDAAELKFLCERNSAA